MTEFTFDTPVVRKIQLPPARIVKAYILRVRDVAEMKTPALNEREGVSRPRIGEANLGHKKAQETQDWIPK